MRDIGLMAMSHKRILIVLASVVGVLILGYLALVMTSGSSASSGTSVQGVPIGGLSAAAAEQAVADELDPIVRKRLRIEALDQTFPYRPEALGISLDAEASVAPAFGRTWNPVDLVGRFFGSSDLPAVLAVDEAVLMAELDVIAESVAVPPTEPSLAIRGGKPVLTAGKPGRALDSAATAVAVEEAVLKPRAPVKAVVVTVEPTVTADAAQTAVTVAESAAASPVTVTAGSITATIPAKAVGRALSFTAQDGQLVPTLDGAILHQSIATELAPIEVAGRDATFKIRNGKVKVVKSKVGSGVSDDELATAVAGVLDLPAAERTVTVSVGVREPKLTTEQAKTLGVKERLSTFTQYFPYAAYRVQNIGQAAERINGTLLMPGETFSLNDTILERTEENGYTEGFVVGVGGVFDEALGGGVSTSATTAWTAAFYAGMERVQTVAHSIYISRYTAGLEATVAWGIFDMKFRNDTPNAVFITSSITNGSITVSLWGTKQYDDIKAEFGERTNIRKFTTVYDESEDCLGQSGVNGFTITVDRVFYKDGEEVKREPITTTYKPAPEVICEAEPKPKPDKGKKGNGDAPDETDPSADPSTEPAPDTDPAPAEPPAGDDTFSNG